MRNVHPMKRLTLRRGEAGFSLVELMIAVALGLIILAALTTFFVQTSDNRRELDRNTRQIENGRYAIDSMREDISLAGFYSDTAPLVVPTWVANDACAATAAANFGFAVAPAYTAPLPIFGYALGGVLPGCLTNTLPSDVVVVRRFHTESNTPAEAAAGPNAARWFLQNSQCFNDDPLEPFKVAQGAAAGTLGLHTVNCTGIARLWRLREQVYFLRNCSVCPPDTPVDNIPTLWRAELDPSNPTAPSATHRMSALVEGIEQLRFDYGVDLNGDGMPDQWRRCDAASPCDAATWSNMTSVKVYVLSRNIDISPRHVDDKTYSLGLSGTVGPFGDGYRRHVYSAQIAMPNRSGSREPQLATAP
jgi:type IV pilus assembly protein PilW